MKTFKSSKLLAGACAALASFAVNAGTVTWVGGGGDWSDSANWRNELNEATLPAAGDDVVIRSDSALTVILGESTPALASLTIGGGAVTNVICATNWNARIEASEVKIAAKGILTCKGAFEKTDMGRVWIKCTNLDVARGGAIDVSYCGYLAVEKLSSGNPVNGYGPGAAVRYGMGASHGGVGGMSVYSPNSIPLLYATPSYDNVLYDDPQAPVEPGSSGRTSRFARGGNGGGAVRVEATGRVTVCGSILACGQETSSAAAKAWESNAHGSGGSGGSIFITCETFAGTNGVLRADGGDGHFQLTPGPNTTPSVYPSASPAAYGDCVGGGGMIAIHYSGSSQTPGLAKDMTISVLAGRYRTITRQYVQTLATADRYYIDGDLGTLHFTDGKLVGDLLGSGLSGRILGFTEWNCDSLTFTNGFVRFQGEGFSLNVAGDLEVRGENSRLDIGGVAMTNRVFRPEIWAGQSQVSLNVGGDLTVVGGARLDLRSAETNAPNSWGAVASVGGTMTVGANGWVYAWCNPVNGGAPKFSVENLTVAAGGTFTAERRGYAGAPGYDNGATTYWNHKMIGYGPTPGYCNTKSRWNGYTFPDGVTLTGTYASGGSHGGLGGLSTATNATTTVYNRLSDDEWRPCLPGSGAGAGPMSYGNGAGGGVICVEAANHIQVDGEINADGDSGYSVYNSNQWFAYPTASGAGGTIFLSSKTFAGAASGVLSARGGNVNQDDDSHDREGAGGGGRIAVWTGEEYKGRINSTSVLKYTTAAECPDCDFAGTATAAGGVNPYASLESECATLNGGDGTGRFVHVLPPIGAIIMVY